MQHIGQYCIGLMVSLDKSTPNRVYRNLNVEISKRENDVPLNDVDSRNDKICCMEICLQKA